MRFKAVEVKLIYIVNNVIRETAFERNKCMKNGLIPFDPDVTTMGLMRIMGSNATFSPEPTYPTKPGPINVIGNA